MTDGREQPRTPSLETVLSIALQHLKTTLRVALPGRVESYDPESQKADIQPLIKDSFLDTDGNSVTESLPVVPDVPIVFPRAGGFYLTVPVAVGDHVLLVANDRSIDKFATGDGEETDPIDLRAHDLSDVVAFPGFYPFTKSIADADAENMQLGKEGGATITFKENGDISIVQGSGGSVNLGADAASQAVARVTDLTVADANMSAWLTVTQAALVAIAGLLNAPGPVIGAPGSVIPPVAKPTDFGVIDTGAANTKAD
jgi:hypothetical protein